MNSLCYVHACELRPGSRYKNTISNELILEEKRVERLLYPAYRCLLSPSRRTLAFVECHNHGAVWNNLRLRYCSSDEEVARLAKNTTRGGKASRLAKESVRIQNRTCGNWRPGNRGSHPFSKREVRIMRWVPPCLIGIVHKVHPQSAQKTLCFSLSLRVSCRTYVFSMSSFV